jgi:hypothetical protein
VSLASTWLEKEKTTRKRASTRDFHDPLRASHARRAHLQLTTAAPLAWLP